jgi:hypothetical protein
MVEFALNYSGAMWHITKRELVSANFIVKGASRVCAIKEILMKNNLLKASCLTGLSFVLFYFSSFYSMSMPYAPTKYSNYLMTYGVFFVLLAVLVFFGFVYKYKPYRKSGWHLIIENERSKTKKLKRLVALFFAVPIFCGIVAFSMQRWLALPTKVFAEANVVENLNCVEKSAWGKSSRNMVMIEAVKSDGETRLEFPWPANRAPRCPGMITITGKAWLFGIYVAEVR